jgi:phospholipid/cholesterol/gamma-HCH transport system substrate-binding protein
LAKDAPEIAGSLKRASQILEKDLLKPENVRHIDASLANIEQTTENVARVSAELEQTRKVVHDATVAFDKLVKDNAGNIDESMRDLRYTLDTVSRNVDDIAENFAATARNMAEFSHQIRDNPGLILRGASPPDESKQGRK